MEENKEACKSNGETRVNKEDNNKKEADEKEPELPLMSLNHVSAEFQDSAETSRILVISTPKFLALS